MLKHRIGFAQQLQATHRDQVRPEAQERRTQLKRVVESFAQSHPRCRILVTSRTYAYQRQEWRLSGFQVAELAPFTLGQIRCFVDRWYDHVAERRGMRAEQAKA